MSCIAKFITAKIPVFIGCAAYYLAKSFGEMTTACEAAFVCDIGNRKICVSKHIGAFYYSIGNKIIAGRGINLLFKELRAKCFSDISGLCYLIQRKLLHIVILKIVKHLLKCI